MTEKQEPDHWLARPETIRKLWMLLAGALAIEVLAQFVFPVHGHFGLDGVFGFGAWYGFAACVVLVVIAKALSIFVKRPDAYYDD